jgi:adapter protein MecA 1/2
LKIERLSENKIKCTLNKADLKEKQVKLSELAYGSPKARELFQEMMQQASIELGFDVDNTPLMIEAVPINPDCLILIVTKVSDPEELDTRFSKFSPANDGDYEDENYDDDGLYDPFDADTDDSEAVFSDSEGSDSYSELTAGLREVVNNFLGALANSAASYASEAASKDSTSDATSSDVSSTEDIKSNKQEDSSNMVALFTFDSIMSAIDAAQHVAHFYFGKNTLYKDPTVSERYFLLLTSSKDDSVDFARTCNILSEFGQIQRMNYATQAHFAEHYQQIVADEALQTLAAL